jgi:pentatricopeptide repeat protein
MLEKMELPVEDGGYDVEPDRLSYALTILACSRCPDATFGSTIALANLEKMESRALLEERKRQQVSSAAPPSVSLDAECFNVVLTALSKSRSQEAVPRMLEIVERMEGYANSSDGNKYIRPTIRSWNAVLNGLSRSKEKGSAKKAEEILHHLFDLDAEGVPESKPDAFSFAAVLSAYQRTWNLAGIQRADDIVRKMEEWYERGILDKPPDVYHYTIVCAAWARVKGAQRCIQILNHMMERHKAGYPAVKPNARTYNAVLDALARSDEAEKSEQLLYHMLMLAQNGDEGARPDSFSFNAVINAYTRSKLRDGGKRAESVLDRFLEHSEEFPKVKPDIRSFTNIVAYYGRSKLLDAPYRAEYVLNRLVALYRSGYNHLAPNVFAVTTVIDSYAQHEHPDAGECAERLLRLMHKLRDEYGASELSINTGVMNSVLNAWASCGHDNAGKRANALLLDMEEKYEDGKSELKPNARSYCLVLSAWSKSLADNKAGKALEILNRMQSRYDEGKLNTRPGEHPHSLVINACAFTNSSPHTEEEAFKIAVQIMTKFSKTSHLQPSSVSFAWFLQACGRLTVPSGIKDDNVERAWQTCCDNGLVNDFVLSRLKGAASDAQFKELVRPALKKMNVSDKNIKQKISISHLPRDWTRKKRSLKGSSARDFSKGRKKERRVTKN